MKRIRFILGLGILMILPLTACARFQNRVNSSPTMMPTQAENQPAVQPTAQPTPAIDHTSVSTTSSDDTDALINDLDKMLSQMDSQLKNIDTIPESIP